MSEAAEETTARERRDPVETAAALLGTVEAPEAEAEESGSEDQTAEEAEAQASQEAEAQQEPEEYQLPDLSPELPEDLRDMVDEPDFEAEAAAEAGAGQSEEEPTEENYEQYDDASLQEERRKRIVAEKRAKWLEDKSVRDNRGKWEAEAKKYFPLSEPFVSQIQATSRRAFNREAKELHEALRPYVEENFIKPLKEMVAKTSKEIKEEADKESSRRWGPAVSGGETSDRQEVAIQRLDSARRHGGLADLIKAKYMPREGG